MAKIVKLDDALSNKIAAGEVVERPASIVKELIENAIDANSSHILLEVEEGGLNSIRIVDNGDGMVEEDALAAFHRHATSKIKTDRDLFNIVTLGFRGEALPSIASVSHMTLTTSTGDGSGVKLFLEGGKIIEKNVAHARKGTEIVVTGLFYNTPARLKYLKTIHTEMGNISDAVNRLALANPNISFECYHNGKQFFRSAGNGDERQVIAAIYGRTVAQKMKPIEAESLDYNISGYVSLPELTRASRQYITIFINGRYVRNYALAKAIQEGYHTLLPIGRFPVVVLSIEMDPQLIDVNVHPAKLEVRLSKETELGQLITTTITNVFKKETLIPDADVTRRTEYIERKPEPEQIPLNLERHKEENNPTSHVKEPKWEEVVHSEEPVQKQVEKKEKEERIEKKNEKIENKNDDSNAHEVEQSSRLPTLYPVGQMHGTYIVAQNDTGMYLIDQHAAQERIKYEYFKEKVGKVDERVQQLIVPMTFECTASEAVRLNDHIEDLQKVGVFLEVFGPQAFIVRSHPTWLPKGYEEETIREMIDYLLEHRTINITKLREEAAILMSCKAAIKANRHLRHDEMYALLETLRASSDPFTCPHGRPIIIHFSTYAIEKMFKRVM